MSGDEKSGLNIEVKKSGVENFILTKQNSLKSKSRPFDFLLAF